MSCIVEQAVYHNSPNGLLVNSSYVTTKARRVPISLINTIDQNIWIRQALLATELFEVEVESQQYCAEMNQEGDEVIISFQPVLHMKEKNQ